MKTSTFIEYNGLKLEHTTFINTVKKLWLNEGNKIKDIKTLNLYIKPEEETVYYVINEVVSGHFPLTQAL